MREPATERATQVFVAHRNLLFTVAYGVLGSAADAEDVLQETWLRWAEADVAEDAERAESVSVALLLVLETLSPTERAVFVLREAFGFEYAEIAAAVDKSAAAVRQIAHRARNHVQARRPRQATSPTEARAAVESFQHALQTGDLQHLVDVLAPDVVCIADGGGVRTAARRPIVGAEKVLRFVQGVTAKAAGRIGLTHTEINGAPALLARVDDELDGVISIAVHAGRITGIYYVRNPEKLTALHQQAPLTLR